MTHDELKQAIESGHYTGATQCCADGTIKVDVNGTDVNIYPPLKKAYFCITVDVSDEAIEDLMRRCLDNAIQAKREELETLEKQKEIRYGRKSNH